MKNSVSRRIVPASAVAMIVFGLLVVFEVLIIAGVMQVNASAIARVAPWAYEPFLKMVGEHPDSYRKRGDLKQDADAADADSVEILTGLHFNEPLIDTNEVPEPDPEDLPEEDAPKEEPKKVVPVG